MNIYQVSGRVSFVRTTECDCCGQDTEKDEERKMSVQVEARDEEAAKNVALEKIREDLQARYRNDDVDFVVWGSAGGYPVHHPRVEFVREVSEAELLRRAGAPMLEGFA